MAGKQNRKPTVSKVQKTITKKGKAPGPEKVIKGVIYVRQTSPALPIDKSLSKNKISKGGILTKESLLKAKSSKNNATKDCYAELLRYAAD